MVADFAADGFEDVFGAARWAGFLGLVFGFEQELREGQAVVARVARFDLGAEGKLVRFKFVVFRVSHAEHSIRGEGESLRRFSANFTQTRRIREFADAMFEVDVPDFVSDHSLQFGIRRHAVQQSTAFNIFGQRLSRVERPRSGFVCDFVERCVAETY